MSFNKSDVSDLLTKCHRRCCICHKFCGVKMETHHIEPGNESIENAIPVCFECHAEMRLYDDTHPRGRKYQQEELHKHKEQWLSICDKNPNILIQPLERSDVGPLQALVDEIEFNMVLTNQKTVTMGGCKFREIEFNRVISEGFFSLLPEELKNSLADTYRRIGALNATMTALISSNSQKSLLIARDEHIRKEMPSVVTSLNNTKNLLITFLTGDDE